ncbi:MAG: hypothetical protein E6I58_08475 [Chloroflexi bacterium]|nr:MAG: hypothetical protein E6I58_08475 [Chloroflexota bacterium]
MSTTATHRRTLNPPAVAGFAALAIVLPHVPSFFHRLLDGDEAIYGSIAALMNMGGPLYAEGGVDNKPPGIFWVYAATFRVFGTYQMAAIHAVALLAVIATAFLIFLAGRQVGSTRAGVLAAIFYGVVTAAGNPRLLAANTEVFMMLPLTASVLLMLQRRWVWSGLLLAAAGALRQSAAIQVLLLPFALAYLEPRETRLRALFTFAGGLAAGLVADGVLLALTGSFTGFWRWTIGILAQYAGTSWTPALVWSRAQDSVLPFALATAVLWIAAIAWAARWKRLVPAHRLVTAWLVASLIGSLAGGHLSWHYFIQVMGPLALLAALAIDHALHSPLQREVAAVVALGVVGPALWWGAYDIVADPLTYDWSPPIAKHELVATYIRTHTKLNDRVFVWGDWPALYVESDREMASRFPGFLRGFARGSSLPPNNWDTAPDVWPELQADLERNPPAMIVDTAAANWSDFAMYPMRNYPVVQKLVGTKYRLVAVVDGVAIYARNS